jgi:hypothetical protein
MNPKPATEAPTPRRIGPPEVEALHSIDQIIGNADTITAEQLGEVRGIVLTTLNAWHQQFSESNLLAHAEREMRRAHVEDDVQPSLLQAIAAFRSYGHSGGSSSVCIPLLNDLLNFRSLTPLTDDPDEWIDHTEFCAGDPTFQNNRNSEAFSKDGGKTYYVLSEERRWAQTALGVLPWKLRKRLPHGLYFRLLFPLHRSEPAR